ncbi:hypothetical protein DU508_15425 [Pedobacter chinensis]|uniref:TonB-dependent receptor plug domain-containing protein n=1 Tax=Pedobacter chinensis TaxID=2282421 RepID=A0A369PTP9_9SPHI|nr:hypothetical protein DU508_15425 [Pedobacter chinensis]
MPGPDASDILRKVPMINVDGNGAISVLGSANIKVLIDGKPFKMYAFSIADALRAIRREYGQDRVITSPSSRYDAQGTHAVVNNITRKIRFISSIRNS